MSRLLTLYRSGIGRKWAMAISGILLFGFVLVHMAGNLKMYQGPEAYNTYAEALRTVGKPFFGRAQLLWAARLTLIAAVLVHMHAAWTTTRRSHAAREVAYRRRRAVQMTYAERTMRWGGVVIAFFVVYHLLHLTWGVAHSDFRGHDASGYHVYHNVVAGFSVWWVSLVYIIGNVILGFHLYHGLWSMFQSMGWTPAGERPVRREIETGRDWRRVFATVFAWVVTLGNVSFPIAVLAGIVA